MTPTRIDPPLRAYGRDGALSTAEQAIRDGLRTRITGRRLLDIGVGGSRATQLLFELSHDYIAIDYREG
jgi:hypothetical protein